jgi:hypothetical protein
MRERDDWFERLKQVERDFAIATLALEQLREHVRTDISVLGGLRPRLVVEAIVRLEATYFVRLFAVFEAGLLVAWRSALNRDTQPPMRDLLDGIASARGIPHPPLAAAHLVRVYRNTLVHEHEDAPGPAITFEGGHRHLRTYLSYLPPDW